MFLVAIPIDTSLKLLRPLQLLDARLVIALSFSAL